MRWSHLFVSALVILAVLFGISLVGSSIWFHIHEGPSVPVTGITPVMPSSTGTPADAATTSASSAIATTTAATSTVSVPSGTYDNVALRLGTSDQFFGDLTITPESIVEDSRCAVGVLCIQAGTVRVALSADSPSGTNGLVIGLGKSVTVNGETITLKAVSPDKAANVTIAPTQYMLTFSITKPVPSTAP